MNFRTGKSYSPSFLSVRSELKIVRVRVAQAILEIEIILSIVDRPEDNEIEEVKLNQKKEIKLTLKTPTILALFFVWFSLESHHLRMFHVVASICRRSIWRPKGQFFRSNSRPFDTS